MINTILNGFTVLVCACLSTQAICADAEVPAGVRESASVETPQAFHESPLGRRLNLQTSPVGLLFRRYNAAAEIGIFPSLAVGLKGTNFPGTISGVFSSTSGYEMGTRATWYPGSVRFAEGIIFRGSVFYKNTQTHNDLADALGNAAVRIFTLNQNADRLSTIDVTNGPAVELMGGYQMVLPTGFNMDWNIGLTTYQHYLKVVNLDTGSEVIAASKSWRVAPVFEFNVGWVF